MSRTAPISLTRYMTKLSATTITIFNSYCFFEAIIRGIVLKQANVPYLHGHWCPKSILEIPVDHHSWILFRAVSWFLKNSFFSCFSSCQSLTMQTGLPWTFRFERCLVWLSVNLAVLSTRMAKSDPLQITYMSLHFLLASSMERSIIRACLAASTSPTSLNFLLPSVLVSALVGSKDPCKHTESCYYCMCNFLADGPHRLRTPYREKCPWFYEQLCGDIVC